MPEINIPLFNGVYRNIDETVANDKSFKMVDAILDAGDGTPSLSSRPGLSLLKTAATVSAAFDGMIWIDSWQKLLAVSGGTLLSFDTAYAEVNSAGQGINTGTRPTFAFDGTYVFVANGGKIMYWDGIYGNPSLFLADADAPSNYVTHIFIIDGYLIANDYTSGTWKFAETGSPLSWNALDFASAEGVPDDIISGLAFRGEAYFFGRESLEIWEDDGQTPFARVNGALFDTGCIAPYSPIALDNEVMWLSDDRRFVKFAGAGVEKISTQYDRDLAQMAVVDDCTSDRYDILGKTLIVFQFPSEQRTIVYNMTDGNWGEFGFWNAAGGFHEAFLGSCHAFIPETGVHIVGSRKTAKLYSMTEDAFTDDGTQIKMLTRSGHINYGTNKRKRNENISIRVKRGYVTDTTEPVATLRFRDDNGEWSQEIQFSLGLMGDYFSTVRLQRLGMYVTRQLEFACTDPVGFVFSEAKEELTAMSR